MKNLVLIGMPSCGKSVTGVILAKSLKMSFIDTDLLIQEEAGKSLQEIIDEDGMEKFKAIEERVLCDLKTNNTVIATGGSAVYYESAMNHLRENGIIVYIEVSLAEIERRLKNITTRGVAMDRGQSMESLYAMRLPLYEKYADRTVSADGSAVEDTVAAIIETLRLQ